MRGDRRRVSVSVVEIGKGSGWQGRGEKVEEEDSWNGSWREIRERGWGRFAGENGGGENGAMKKTCRSCGGSGNDGITGLRQGVAVPTAATATAARERAAEAAVGPLL